jgi:predicted  nucleic acid-binding Zn-ribbon protein
MQLTHANERLARAKASSGSAQAAVMERMEQLKAEYNTLSSDRQTNDKQLAALRHEATTIENDVRYLWKLATQCRL